MHVEILFMFQMKTFRNRWTHKAPLYRVSAYFFLFLLITMALHDGNEKKRIRWPTQLIYCSAWAWHAIKTVFLFFIIISIIIMNIVVIGVGDFIHTQSKTHTRSTLFVLRAIVIRYDLCVWCMDMKRSNYDETVFWEICSTTPYLVYWIFFFSSISFSPSLFLEKYITLYI